VGETIALNSFTITSDEFEGLTNDSTYYIAVVPYDDTVAKSTVEPFKLDALGANSEEDGAGDSDSPLSIESLLTTPNLIAAGMFVIVLLLVILVVRGRNNTKQRSKTWELQEATWGIQDASWDTPAATTPPAAPAPPPGITTQQANDIYAAANQIQSTDYGRPAYQAPQPVLKPQVDPSLLDGLLDDPAPAQKMPEIDTSFLDDLL